MQQEPKPPNYSSASYLRDEPRNPQAALEHRRRQALEVLLVDAWTSCYKRTEYYKRDQERLRLTGLIEVYPRYLGIDWIRGATHSQVYDRAREIGKLLGSSPDDFINPLAELPQELRLNTYRGVKPDNTGRPGGTERADHIGPVDLAEEIRITVNEIGQTEVPSVRDEIIADITNLSPHSTSIARTAAIICIRYIFITWRWKRHIKLDTFRHLSLTTHLGADQREPLFTSGCRTGLRRSTLSPATSFLQMHLHC